MANFYLILKKRLAPINNGTECPNQPIFVNNQRFSSVVFDDKNIMKIIRAFNINNSYGHDDISIRITFVINI